MGNRYYYYYLAYDLTRLFLSATIGTYEKHTPKRRDYKMDNDFYDHELAMAIREVYTEANALAVCEGVAQVGGAGFAERIKKLDAQLALVSAVALAARDEITVTLAQFLEAASE